MLIFIFFFVSQKTGRIYAIGTKQVEIPDKVIKTLRTWNTCRDKRGSIYDKNLITSLLLVCADPDDILRNNISDELKDFIRGIFSSNFTSDSRSVKTIQFEIFHISRYDY